MDTSAQEYVPVAKITDVQDGKPVSLTVNGHQLLLALVEGKYYAADDHCPHMDGITLHEGTLDGTVLTCPRHMAKFDLTDGSVIRWPDWTSVKAGSSRLFSPPRPLVMHPVRIDGDTVFVQF